MELLKCSKDQLLNPLSIVSGIVEGEMIVVDGSMSVQDGMNVTVKDVVKEMEK